jgi:hypothetical protein
MSIIEDNIATLLKSHPYLELQLAIEPEQGLVIMQSLSGQPTATYKGFYVHSKHNPEREARTLMESEIRSEVSSCVFFGFGLGYQVEAFIKAQPGVPVLVVEGDPAFFRKALESRDMRFVLRAKQVEYFLRFDPDTIIDVLEQMPLANIQIIKIRSVYVKDEAYYKQVNAALESYLARKEVNLNTLRRFGKRWVANLARNLKELIRAPGISTLTGAFGGLPGIVLASGPSLERILPLLPELAKRLVVISVDTSASACLRAGVDPDFLVVVDPQYWNTRHLDWVDTRRSILVSESSTHPRVFHMLDLPLFFSSSFFPLGTFFESIAGEKGKIGAGGSVATASWDIARILGLDPIYMAGLDLGYPDKKTHFKGAFFEQAFHTVSQRLKPSETFELAYLFDADPYFAKSNSGTLTLTDQRMHIYGSWFATQMKIFRDTHTYNLSRSGILVEGMEPRNIDELMALPVVRDRIDETTDRIRESALDPDAKEIGRKTDSMKGAIVGLLDDMKGLLSAASTGLDITGIARERMVDGKIPAEILAKLDAVDKVIGGDTSRLIAGFLLQPIIQGIIHSPSAHQTANALLDTTERFYRELKESTEFHYDVLSHATRDL